MNRDSLENAADSADARRHLPWLVILFIGSGAAALIYEIVWFQLMQLVIGLTNVSLGVLLGTFMGGMCLGSILLPRVVTPRRHPLRVYALLELGIAVIGIGMPFAMPWVADIYTEYAGSGTGSLFLRAVLAAVLILPPTLLMGATLPAMARWVQTSRQGVSWLGIFYGGNIAGAVVGCLFAGFYLLRVHDMATATYVAAGINVAVASIALVMGTVAARSDAIPAVRVPEEKSSAPFDVAADLDTSRPARRRELDGTVYVAIGLSGMAALGAEVVWTRLLSMLMGGTVYTFSIILAVFLFGLGIGSSGGAWVSRSTNHPRFGLAACQALLVGAVGWTVYMTARSLPFWPIDPSLSLSPWYNFQLDLARGLWAVLPASILWGASFPLALAAVSNRETDSGRVVAAVYAANTVGAIVGALAFTLIVIPLAGTLWAQRSLVAIPALAAVVVLLPSLRGSPLKVRSGVQRGIPRGRLALTALAAVAGAAWLITALPAVPWGIFAYGRFMATYGNRLAAGIVEEKSVPSEGGTPDIYCTYLGEGLNGTVAVTRWTSGVRNFHSAGKVQASTDPRDMRLQRMLGHLSALGHRRPESVLVVACGAGVTAGSFVVHPTIRRIVICDIEPLVPKFVAPLFEKENYAVLKDPRTQVVSDDGRHFIRTTKEKFDIITSDPIDPWVKGCAALNTVEYYEMCKAHLNPGGVMSLWIPLYESSPETVKSVIGTFFSVFPNGLLFSNDDGGEGYDAVLFGQVEPTRFQLDELQDRLNLPDHARVKASLEQVEFKSAIELLATYAGQASDLTDWLKDAQINTDRNLRLQYLAGFWLNSYMGGKILGQITRFYQFPDTLFVGSEPRRRMLRLRLDSRRAGVLPAPDVASSRSRSRQASPGNP